MAFNIDYGKLTLDSLADAADRFAHGQEEVLRAFTDLRVLLGRSKPIKGKVVLTFDYSCNPETGNVDLVTSSKVTTPHRVNTHTPILLREGEMWVEQDDAAAQLNLVRIDVHPNLQRPQE